MAARTAKVPTVSPADVTHTLASAKPATCGAAFTTLVTAFGEKVAGQFAAADCRRLPRHHDGHKVGAKPRGLMTAAEKRAASARLTKAAASKRIPQFATVTLKGQKFLVPLDKAGSPVFAKAEPVVAEHVTKTASVKVLKPAVEKRRVAAPAKVTHRTRSVTSGAPSARLA
jgi:hypothetical protein